MLRFVSGGVIQMISRRDFIKLSSLGLIGVGLPRCGGDDDDVGRAEFGFHLNPVLINGTNSQAFSGNPTKSLGSDPDTKYFSYQTPSGIRYLPLPLENGLAKAYPASEDYERIKRIGDFVSCNLWELYWNDPQDGPEMRNIIERCAGNALNLIIRLEDTTRIANHPNAGPTDEEWFVNTFEPYVRSVVRYARGKVFAYQVWNEPWESSAGHYMLGPTGELITNQEYIDFLARVRSVIKSEDPGVDVLNAGLCSIVESDFNSRVKDLLDRGIQDYTDIFNFHYYTDGHVSSEDELKLIELDLKIDKDVIITETNHINPYAGAAEKLATITDIRKVVSRWFTLRGMIAFAWNAGTADSELLPWAIKDTALEELLYEEFNQ